MCPDSFVVGIVKLSVVVPVLFQAGLGKSGDILMEKFAGEVKGYLIQGLHYHDRISEPTAAGLVDHETNAKNLYLDNPVFNAKINILMSLIIDSCRQYFERETYTRKQEE